MANTFFHSDTALANGIHTVNDERELSTGTGTSATLQSQGIGGGTEALTHLFTTVVGEPGFGSWPNGLYDTIIRVPTAGGDMTFGCLTIGSAAGHFARINTGATAHVGAVWTQTQGAFSGFGSHTASRTLTPPTGGATDRWEILVAAGNGAAHGNQTITLTVNTTESISTGPWVVPAQEARGEPRMRVLTPGSRINRADPLARDLQAYWLPRGNRVVDLTGHGHDGDFVGSGGGPGSTPRGPSLNHQGTGDFTQIADHPQLGGTPAALTIACVFWDAVAADVVDGVLMQKDDPSTIHHWALEITQGDGFASFHMNTSSGGNQAIEGVRDVSNVEDQKVHVMMGVWDGANMRLYTEGIQEIATPKTGTPSTSTEPINLGRHDDITSRRITGHCLLWAYWRRALSAGEAADFARDPFRVATRPRLDAVTTGVLVTSDRLLRFDVVENVIQTLLLRMDLAGEITQTSASLFDLVESAEATVLARFDTLEQALQDAALLFDLTGAPVKDAILRFDTVVQVEQTRGLRFDLVTQIQKTAALLFDALERATATGLLRFDLSGSLNPPKTATLRFDTLVQVETTSGMRFDTLQRITQTAAALFDVLERATGTRLLRFDLSGQLNPPKDALLRFDTVASAEATRAALFDLLERATQTQAPRFDLIGQPVATVPIRFDLSETITGTVPIRFDLLVQVEATELGRFDTLEQAQATIQARFDLLGQVIKTALGRFDLIGTIPVLRDALLRFDTLGEAIRTAAIRFDTLEAVQAEAAVLFDPLGDVKATRAALFDTLGAVERTAGLRFDLLGQVLRTVIGRFDTLADVIRASGVRFDTLTRTTQTRPVRFDLIGQVEGTAGLRFDLQGTITKTGLIRFDLSLDVTIVKDAILRFDTLELVTKDGVIRFDLKGGQGTGRELLALLGGIHLEGRSRQLGAR